MFWVISVYFNLRNTLPKFGTFLLGHPVYIYVCVCVCVCVFYIRIQLHVPSGCIHKIGASVSAETCTCIYIIHKTYIIVIDGVLLVYFLFSFRLVYRSRNLNIVDRRTFGNFCLTNNIEDIIHNYMYYHNHIKYSYMKQNITFYDCTFILCKYAPVNDKKMSITALERNVIPRCCVVITSTTTNCNLRYVAPY